jgi:hypothetical protein
MGTTVLMLVRNGIQAAGGDGLVNSHGQCACVLSDLAPCDCLSAECQIGYRRICSCGDKTGHKLYGG